MRIARWATAPAGPPNPQALGTGRVREGFVIGDRVHPFPGGASVADVLEGGPILARELHERVVGAAGPGAPLDAVRLLPPLVPAAIRDFVAFEEHVEGVTASVDGAGGVVPEWYAAPTFYFTNPHTVRGTGDIVSPPVTAKLDFELEIAAVVGGPPASDLTPDEAGGHIFGYTIMNDWSARDLQAREMKVRLGPCKGKDFATTLGPWIVTADELAQYVDDDGFLAVRAEVEVNGRPIGADLVSNMGWPFAELVSYASRNSRVVAGDVLGSGTVGGGCLAELWGRGSDLPALRAGDEVRMRVEGLGEIVNVVGDAVPQPEIAPARPRSRARRR